MAHHAGDEHTQHAATAAEGSVALTFFIGGFIALASFLAGTPAPASGAASLAPVSIPTASSPREVVGGSAAIATAAPEASLAGLEVMRRGGNAFDALVAASFVVGVVRPQSTGIGGGGFVVYHDATSGESGALDGREMAPARATSDMYVKDGKVIEGYDVGPLSAGVPGLVKMLHQLFLTKGSGKVSWADLVEPARRLAEDGCTVTSHLAGSIAKHAKKLARYPASREIFLPGGQPLKAGERLVQTALALTLQTIAEEGANGFYTGWVAEELAVTNTEFGGLIVEADLSKYAVKERSVIEGSYRGMTVVSMPPPSSGGVHLVQMLNILSNHDLAGMGWHSTSHLHLMAESMRRAFSDRARFMADTDFVKTVPVEKLIDPAYGKRLSDSIDLHAATPSDSVQPGALFAKEREHTTHLSIVDAAGNAVASTQTINTGLGSCFVAGKTGVLLNNEMADFTADADAPNPFGLSQSADNLPEPGKRPLSSMTPTILLDAEGQVRAVLGSPGGPKIITTVLQTLINIVDFDMGPLDAVTSPRIHHQWKSGGRDKLIVEAGVHGANRLSALGHLIETLGPERGLGNAQVVVVREDGARVAASDPRGTGRPGAYTAAAPKAAEPAEAVKSPGH